MSLKKEIAKANLVFNAGRITSAVISFFFSIILARLLQPHNFGLYSFSIVVASFFVLFTDFGMKSTMIRFIAEYISKGKYRKASTLTKLIFKYKIILILLTGTSVSIFSNQIATFIFNKPEAGFVVFFSGLLLIANTLLDFFNSLFSGLKNFFAVSLIQILQNIFKFIFVIGLVLLGMSVVGAIVGLIISYFIAIVSASVIVYKKYNFIISKPKVKLNRKILLVFSIWVFAVTVVATIYGLIDQLMISNMLTIEDVGFYRIALTWMSSIALLVPITTYVLYPYFSGTTSKKHLNLMFFNSLRYSAIFIFPLAFLFSAYSRPFILFLYKESFLPTSSALSILVFVSIFSLLYGVTGSYFASIKRPDITAKVLFCTMVLNAILNYFLIQLYGISGAAIATLISAFINFMILFSIAIFAHNMMFRPSIILKPLTSAVIVYCMAMFFLPNVTDYFTLVFYVVLLLTIYFMIMFLIKGITKQDIDYFRKGINVILRRV
jgi:stage V sporulation protein B